MWSGFLFAILTVLTLANKQEEEGRGRCDDEEDMIMMQRQGGTLTKT